MQAFTSFAVATCPDAALKRMDMAVFLVDVEVRLLLDAAAGGKSLAETGEIIGRVGRLAAR